MIRPLAAVFTPVCLPFPDSCSHAELPPRSTVQVCKQQGHTVIRNQRSHSVCGDSGCRLLSALELDSPFPDLLPQYRMACSDLLSYCVRLALLLQCNNNRRDGGPCRAWTYSGSTSGTCTLMECHDRASRTYVNLYSGGGWQLASRLHQCGVAERVVPLLHSCEP